MPNGPANESAGALPEPLDTIFLTGPGGRVYEVPRQVADKYLLGLARIRELGHLPIVPYGTGDGASARSAGGDVEGRHQVMLPSGVLGFHTDVQYGTFQATDGAYYVGDHYHPYGTELGFAP